MDYISEDIDSLFKPNLDLLNYIKQIKEEEEKSRKQDGLVYCLADDSGRFKIGSSINVTKRSKQLQTGNPEKLSKCFSIFVKFRKSVETSIRKKLAEYKIRGEWICCSTETIIQAFESEEYSGWNWYNDEQYNTTT
jgi:hypothetical protein